MQQSSSGHMNNGRSTGASAPPPRRSLANLLSTQRRSAAQTDRYRVQRARPFADSSQVNKAVPKSVNGDNDTASASPRQSRWGGSNQSSSLGRGGGSGNGVSFGGATLVSQPQQQPQQRSPTSNANGRSTHDNAIAIPPPNNSAAKNTALSSSSSRRVKFGEESSTITVKPEERPRKRRKSRWDVRPKEDVPTATDTNDIASPIQQIQKGVSSPGLDRQKKPSIIKNGSASKTSILKGKTSEQTSEGGEKETIPHKWTEGEVSSKTNGPGDSRTSTTGESNDAATSCKRKTKDLASAQSSAKSGETANNNAMPTLDNNPISSDTEAFVDDDSPKSVALGEHKPGNKVPLSTKTDGNVRDTSSLDAKAERRRDTAVSADDDRPSRDSNVRQTSKSKAGQKGEDLQQQSKSKMKSRKALDNGSLRDLSSLSKSDGTSSQMLSKQPELQQQVKSKAKSRKALDNGSQRDLSSLSKSVGKASRTLSKQPNGDRASKDVDAPSLRKDSSAFDPRLTKRKQIKPAQKEASHTVEQKSSDSILKQQQQGLTSPAKKKKKKEFSPFRIKVGCVAAARFRKLADGSNSGIVPVVKDGDSFRFLDEPAEDAKLKKQSDEQQGDANAQDTTDKGKVTELNGTNTNGAEETTTKEKNRTKRSLKYYEVWSDPIAGKDDGLALLGSWIKCVFTKSFIINWQKNNGNDAQEKLGRFVEGNVISILGNRECGRRGMAVCLLIDRSLIKSLPFLEVVSDDVIDTNLSSSAKKRRELEAKIRGEDKVVVRVVLASIFDRTKGAKSDPSAVSWVIRKRVSAKPAGKKPSQAERKRNEQHAHALFVGDNNDSQAQQEQNWRWIASKCGSMSAGINHADQTRNMQDSMSQLVGEVVKVDVSPNGKQDSPDTLATVTIRRLVTPEQTKFGRQAHHSALELLDASHDERSSEVYLQAPIEDLIVIGKQTNRLIDGQDLNSTSRDDVEWNFNVTHSYSANNDSYMPLSVDDPSKPASSCHYCQRLCIESMLNKCRNKKCKIGTSWCQQCLKTMNVSSRDGSEKETWQCPCCLGKCDRQGCCSASYERSVTTVGTKKISEFKDLVASLMTKSPVDFKLPDNIGQLSLRPSYTPLTGSNKSKVYSKADAKDEKKSEKATPKKKKRASLDSAKKPRKKLKTKLDVIGHEEEEDDDDDVFKPVCHREIPFDQLSQRRWGSSKLKLAAEDIKQPFFRENFRPRVIKIGKTEEKTTLTGRAARANQRRMVKSLTAFGDTATKVDHLAGRDREQQLRFDKSKIHGWGVFAEENINAGDMIIEYRGEIIGNAVADKRELEYEKNKFDDYMFRIDAYTVCDATMLGNVARYINASCSPSCHTKIIAAGENKRIVIYAKRDIKKGEELSYDYKFSLEYDSTKRIPCHCGGLQCRGYMNWDKKYV